MYKLLSFLKRDFRIYLSYRFRIFLGFISLAGAVFMFYFMGRLFDGGFSGYLARYGNDYFAFVLLGMCVSTFVSTGLYSLASEVRNAQMQGTLEFLLSTPTPASLVLFGNSLWAFVKSFIQSALFLAVAVVIVGINVNLQMILLVVLVLLLTFLCFLSLGMISAAFIMVFKQGNPINLIFGTMSYFFGGLIFPVEVLPEKVRGFSAVLPMYHASRAVREILLVAPAESEWKGTVLFLAVFSAILFPAGLGFMRLAVSRARKEGSLVQF